MAIVTLPFITFDLQARAILSEAQITALVTGKRGGKTKAGAMRVLLDAWEQPGYYRSDALAGEPYQIAVGAPTYRNLKEVALPEVLRAIPDYLKIGKYHETDKYLLVRGSLGTTKIWFKSCKDVRSWLGLKLYRIWADEFPIIKPEVYDEFFVRLSDRQGKVFLTGTPEGPNWVYERIYEPWIEAEDARRRGIDLPENHVGRNLSFHSWRTRDNPFIDPAYVELQRSTMSPKYFRRSFEVSWESFEGQIYDMVVPQIHYRDPGKYKFFLQDNITFRGDGPENIYLQRIVAGVDWGYTHLGVIGVYGKDSLGRWWILEESVSDQVVVPEDRVGTDCWVKRAKDLRKRWGVEVFYAGPDRPENIHHFRRAGIKVRPANNEVNAGIQTIAGFFHRGATIGEPELIILKSNPQHIREIGQYHWKIDRMSGKNLEEPEKIDDDAMDTMRYGIHSDETRGKFKRERRRGKVYV